jgi:hypothetical protein
MAAFSIIEATPIYYLIEVCFGERSFRQLLASALVNGDLQAMLQAYADKYEQDWLAMQPEPA